GDRRGAVSAHAAKRDDATDDRGGNRVNSTSRSILVIILIALAGGAGFWIGRHRGGAEDKPDSPPTEPAADEDKAIASVTVATVREGEIADTIAAYGSVIADPGEVRVLSVPFEARVGRVLVTPGQEVSADMETLVLEASPDTKVALKDAQN